MIIILPRPQQYRGSYDFLFVIACCFLNSGKWKSYIFSVCMYVRMFVCMCICIYVSIYLLRLINSQTCCLIQAITALNLSYGVYRHRVAKMRATNVVRRARSVCACVLCVSTVYNKHDFKYMLQNNVLSSSIFCD